VDKNPEAARKAVKSLRQGVKVLARQPDIGRPMADMPSEFREWLIDFGHSGYVVLYHFDGRQATSPCGIKARPISDNRQEDYRGGGS
jgi:plasmid stabilization system protein ParE